MRSTLPAVPEFCELCLFPDGAPFTSPPSPIYYASRIFTAVLSEATFLTAVLELEYAVMFVATWWHDASDVQGGSLVPEETIKFLEG